MRWRTVPPPKSRKPGSSTKGPRPEPAGFSRELAADSVPDTGLDVEVAANETECAALADAYGLVAVQTFEAGFHVPK